MKDLERLAKEFELGRVSEDWESIISKCQQYDCESILQFNKIRSMIVKNKLHSKLSHRENINLIILPKYSFKKYANDSIISVSSGWHKDNYNRTIEDDFFYEKLEIDVAIDKLINKILFYIEQNSNNANVDLCICEEVTVITGFDDYDKTSTFRVSIDMLKLHKKETFGEKPIYYNKFMLHSNNKSVLNTKEQDLVHKAIKNAIADKFTVISGIGDVVIDYNKKEISNKLPNITIDGKEYCVLSQEQQKHSHMALKDAVGIDWNVYTTSLHFKQYTSYYSN